MHQFELIDPRGFLCPLTATSAEALRILVTRKLAAGWSYPPTATVQLVPLHDEAQLAIPAAPVALKAALKFDTPDDE